ncbi:MAG: DNA-binding domain-containing protein [Bdellovibrionota bacterium]
MRRVLTQPKGVFEALEEDKRNGTKGCLEFIVDQAPLSREKRLDIYANGYFMRLLECMASDFEVVHRLIGPHVFRSLVAEYLSKHPSKTFSIDDVGEHFPRFLRYSETTNEMPWLADLAQLEWLCYLSIYAHDLPGFDRGKLAKMSEDDWAGATLALDSSVRLFRSSWSIDELWELEELDLEQAKEDQCRLVVYRRNFNATFERLEPLAFEVLAMAQAGFSLGTICEKLAGLLSPGQEPPPLMGWFQDWIECGILRDVRRAGEP